MRKLRTLWAFSSLPERTTALDALHREPERCISMQLV